MTVYAPAPARRVDLLAQVADDVQQLTRPYRLQVIREWHTWSRTRNKVLHRQVVSTGPYLPLLDALRQAAAGGLPQHVGAGQIRRGKVSGSPAPPGWREAASTRLAELYVGLSAWHARLALPSPPRQSDWQKWVLRKLPGTMADLDQQQQAELAHDVRLWHHRAARQAGHDPQDLLDARGGSSGS